MVAVEVNYYINDNDNDNDNDNNNNNNNNNNNKNNNNREHNVDAVDKWYEHDPKTVVEKDDNTILYDMPIQTDRATTANQPDIVIKNKWENKCTLIEVPCKQSLLRSS